MLISSSSDTQSILHIARQSALDRRSKDKNDGEAEGSFPASSSSNGVAYGQGYSSFQSSLAKASLDDNAPPSPKGVPSVISTGSGMMADALSKTDWGLIQRATGLTPANDKTGNWLDADGNAVSSGAAFEQAGAMVFGLADMRISAYQVGSPISGDITADQLRQYFQKYENAAANGTGPFTSIDLQGFGRAIGVLNSSQG